MAAGQIKGKIAAVVADAFKGKAELPEVYKLLSDSSAKGEAYMTAAKQALAQGHAQQARLILETLLEREPGNVDAQLLLVKACLKLKGPGLTEAVVIAREAHAAPGGQEASALCVAVALGHRARLHDTPPHLRQEDREQAIELLSNAASTSPSAAGVAHAHYLRAVLQAEHGQPDAALQSVKAALSAAEKEGGSDLSPLCLTLITLLLSARQQHKTALSVLSAAQPAPSSEAGLLADVLVTRVKAKLLAALSDTARALTQLAQCKKRLAPIAEGRAKLPAGCTTQDAQVLLAQVWQDLAVLFAQSAQQPEALVCIDNARGLQPWSASACHALGQVHEACGDAEQAMQAYNDALAVDPCHAGSLQRLGALYRQRGGRSDLGVARDLLAEALRYQPTSPQAWYNLGKVAAALDHRAEAESHMLTAVQLAAATPIINYSALPLLLPV